LPFSLAEEQPQAPIRRTTEEEEMIGNHRRIVETGSDAAFRVATAVILGVIVSGAAGCGSEESTLTIGDASQPGLQAVPVERGSLAVVDSEAAGEKDEIDPATLPPSLRPDPAPVSNVTYGDAERVFRTGDYVGAAELFEAYAIRMPQNPWGHYMLGISAWRAGDHPRAEAALRRTVEVDAKHRKGLLNLGRVLLEQRRASDALDFVLEVVALDPELGEGWRVLGNAHAELGMTDDAAEAYRRAIELDPQDAWTMNNLGLLRVQSGEYDLALAPLARATELEPGVATFQNNLGVALERAGHMAHAADAFRAALASEETHPKALVSLERVEARLPSSKPEMFDVSELAAEFAAEVRRWQAESRTARSVGPE
jgi:Flp pilus assembly protein TadD